MAFDTTPWIRDGDTIDAEVIRRALGTLIGTAGGIVTPGDLNVTQNGTPNMSVNVGTGQIWVPGTSTSTQGPYYGMNKATVNVPINAADPTNPRVETIAVQVEDPSYGGSGTAMAPVALAGTPTAGVSTPPTTAAQAASDGAASVPASAYVIAYVLVPANATTISNSDISNVAASVRTPISQQSTYYAMNLAVGWGQASGALLPSATLVGSRVFLAGGITGGSTPPTTFATLPSNMRPSGTAAVAGVVPGGTQTNIAVGVDGTLTLPSTSAGMTVYMDGQNFSLT